MIDQAGEIQNQERERVGFEIAGGMEGDFLFLFGWKAERDQCKS